MFSSSQNKDGASERRHPPDIMDIGDPMDRSIRKFASFEEMKDEEYRYWQGMTPAERIAAGHQMSVEAYRASGCAADGRELRTVAVRFQREPR